MNIRSWSAISIPLLGLSFFVSHLWSDEKEIRVISCGWNAPTAGQFARDIGRMPGDLPLDGCVMTLHSDSGSPDPLATTHSLDDWSALDVNRSVDALAAVSKKAMPENYLLCKANPGDVDWLNDSGWKTIVEHYRLAARIARRGGLRGLLLDLEPYTEPFRQFHYWKQAGAKDHSFAEYQTFARKRGEEVMAAIAEEFPDCEVCTYFLLSYLVEDHAYRGPSPVGRFDANWCLAGHSYGLLPAFVDGWLDAAPQSIKIIDGCENGYWFQSAEEFERCAKNVRQRAPLLLSAENRDKYREQIRVAFPIFLDAIHPTFAGKYTLQPERPARLELLRRNLSAGIAAGDGLVWLYGERGRWWPEAGEEALWRGKDTYPHWETQLPGVTQIIREVVQIARQPVDPDASLAPSTVAGSAKDEATAKNDSPQSLGEIEATVLDVEPTWETWKTGEAGKVTLDAGQVSLVGVEEGAGMASVETESGRRYMVQVQVIQQGRGLTKLTVRWRTPDGKWASTKKHDVIAYPPDGDPNQPRTITAVVKAPADPHQLVVVCSASQQFSAEDEALFGNLLIGLVDD